MNIDPSKLSCQLVVDTPEGSREMWIRYSGSLIAIGRVERPDLPGVVHAQNVQYCIAAQEYLQKNFPEYEWK